MLKDFMELGCEIEDNVQVQEELQKFVTSLKRKDLRKTSNRVVTWNLLNELRQNENLKDGLEGILADLAVKWEKSLNKSFDKLHK